jgi:hypothetical protein
MNLILQPDSAYLVSQWLFLKLLGGVYLLAFASLLAQLAGLYGSRGLLPISDYIAFARGRLGRKRLFSLPSLFWFNSSDDFLKGCAWTGVGCALLLIAGVWPPLMLLILWLLYLSFVATGQDFLSFQWDTLLLEIGFMSIFFALVTPPSLLMIAAYWFFLFRFLISAGTVKLTSHDPTWRELRALSCHYLTQPLPNRPAWHLHQLPGWFQRLSTLGTFFFELLVPFLLLLTAPLRLVGVLLTLFFQLLIMASGNYGFFNLLTIALAVTLIDGRYLQPLQELLAPAAAIPVIPLIPVELWPTVLVSLAFIPFFLLNGVQLLHLLHRPAWSARLMQRLAPLLISNAYGLFAVMTTTRLELEIEGSDDQQEWRRYDFRWKPGALQAAPRQVAPHMPRLDWQMWFAALDPYQPRPWLTTLQQRLLQGVPEVTALLRSNPFPVKPPTYIRMSVYNYTFTDRTTRRATGDWWQRDLVGRYPPMSLRQTD